MVLLCLYYGLNFFGKYSPSSPSPFVKTMQCSCLGMGLMFFHAVNVRLGLLAGPRRGDVCSLQEPPQLAPGCWFPGQDTVGFLGCIIKILS